MSRTITPSPRTSPLRRSLLASTAVGAALVLAACGGGDDDAEVVETTTTEAEATTTTAAGSINALPSGVEVDTTVWYGSFEIGLADPALEEVTPENPELTVELSLSNLYDGAKAFSGGSVQLWIDDEQTISGDFDGPSVPALGSGTGTLSFDLSRVDPDIDLEAAEIRFGTDSGNQAIVPLDGEDVVSLEPVEVDLGESVVVGAFTFDVATATFSYNDVSRNQPLDAGTALMTLAYETTLDGGVNSATRSIPVNDWRVTLPDGSQVSPAFDTGSRSVDRGTTERDQAIGFELPDFEAGDYVVTLAGKDAENEDVTGTLTVTVTESELEGAGGSGDSTTTTEADGTTTTTEG